MFGILFALSAGKLKFWIFPNLTEDVGFIESFWPIYDYTYTGGSKKKKDKVKAVLSGNGNITRWASLDLRNSYIVDDVTGPSEILHPLVGSL